MYGERRNGSYCLLIEIRMVKRKLKSIMPSLREKKRYLAFEVMSKSSINGSHVYDAIHVSLIELMGNMESAKSNMKFIEEKWDSNKQKGIIRVNHKYVDHLKASLALIDNINKEEVIVRSLGVSGILKKATNKYVREAS
ncbi:MAG: Rpp14/Pop5 family protein [Candidatus Woesearchaeota archaeon]|nr:Rpp14/Pop5 family protein [Candidatus Woesearchaeota archaeon]